MVAGGYVMKNDIEVSLYEIVYGLKPNSTSDQIETWVCYTARAFKVTLDEKVLLPDNIGGNYDILSLDACREACKSIGATHWIILECQVRGVRTGGNIQNVIPCVAETNLPSEE